MLRAFNWKYFSFYGGTLIFVVLLFKVVTAYGENNLNPPPKVSGNYQLMSSDLPNCLRSENLKLAIEQSGRYIAGELNLSAQSLARSETSTLKPSQSSPERTGPSKNIILSGLMLSQPFTLSGKTAVLGVCPAPTSPEEVHLQLQFQDKNLSGQLRWSDLVVNFTAKRLEPISALSK